MGDLGEKLHGAVEPALEAGEELRGVCVATQQSMFKGRQVAIATTDRRLLIQPMTRKFAARRRADLDPARSGSPTPRSTAPAAAGRRSGAAIMDSAAVTLKLRTADGEKLKLMMMRGTGPLGGLGGGEDQREGVEAMAAWFAERE